MRESKFSRRFNSSLGGFVLYCGGLLVGGSWAMKSILRPEERPKEYTETVREEPHNYKTLEAFGKTFAPAVPGLVLMATGGIPTKRRKERKDPYF